MKVVRISPENPDNAVLENAAELLRRGKLVIHPTETVYGIAGRYLHPGVLQRTAALKQRAADQPYSIMVSSVSDILKISGQNVPWLNGLLESLLPDALTVLLPRNSFVDLPFWNKFPLLGFRYPAHRLSNLLVEKAGEPLITTSANISALPPASSFGQISEELVSGVDLCLDGGETPQKIPSTIFRVDIENKEIGLIRPGAVNWEKIEKAFSEFR